MLVVGGVAGYAWYLNHLVHGNRPVPSNDVVQTLAKALEVEPELAPDTVAAAHYPDESQVDPRLNYEQSIELAFLIARKMKGGACFSLP